MWTPDNCDVLPGDGLVVTKVACSPPKRRNRTVIGMLFVVTTLTLKVLVTTINAQWEGMGDVGSARYKPALLPPYPTIRVLSYSN